MSGNGALRLSTFASISSFGPNSILPSLVHGEDQIDAGDGARPVRDHDDNAVARPHADNGARERLVAFGIEI